MEVVEETAKSPMPATPYRNLSRSAHPANLGRVVSDWVRVAPAHRSVLPLWQMGKARRPKSELVSVKLPAVLAEKVARVARRRRTTRSAVIRSAIVSMPENQAESVGSLAADLCGKAGPGPSDLSTNPRHFDGFGE